MANSEPTAYLSADPHLFAGTAGWSYGGWVGPFYPKGTKPFEQLMIYAGQMHTVEVDATFHHWIANSTIAGWKDRTPDGFVFCPKMNRAITHDKVLQNCDDELEAFLRSMRILGAKLGPVVIQFAPSFHPSQWSVLELFLKKLPDDIRFAVEVRSRKWLEPDPGAFLDLLRAHRVAYVVSDVPSVTPRAFVTTDFAYARVIGNYDQTETMYAQKGIELHDQKFSEVLLDRTEDLMQWAEYIRQLRAQEVNVFLFFNNHFAGHAPATLREFLALYRAGESVR